MLNYSDEQLQTKIYTQDFLANLYKGKLEENGKADISISNDKMNMKALAYNMIVIATNNKYGVINTNLEEIIGSKYSNISFEDFTNNFIITNTFNKMGVINKEGSIIIDPQYDSLRIINYEPLLYEVKFNNKYGIIDKFGKTVLNIEYDKFGCEAKVQENKNSVLIIKNIENDDLGIVAYKDNKYGIINLSNSKEIVPYELTSVYSKLDQNKNIIYYITKEQETMTLKEYIERNKYNNS